MGNIKKYFVVLLCLCSVLCVAAPPGVFLDVPFVKQERNGCGAASIAMVMQYWQRQRNQSPDAGSDPEQIQRALYSRKAQGIYASDLESYLEQHGLRTFAFRGKWSDLQQHLGKGRPLIVALKPDSGDALHYVVVAGIDGERSMVLVNDPAGRKLLQQDRSEFERAWKGAGNWTLLAIPREGASSDR
jgi:ABC-type bacteriocin/lantibiotic exporter with double-glycine peptidase domain